MEWLLSMLEVIDIDLSVFWKSSQQFRDMSAGFLLCLILLSLLKKRTVRWKFPFSLSIEDNRELIVAEIEKMNAVRDTNVNTYFSIINGETVKFAITLYTKFRGYFADHLRRNGVGSSDINKDPRMKHFLQNITCVIFGTFVPMIIEETFNNHIPSIEREFSSSIAKGSISITDVDKLGENGLWCHKMYVRLLEPIYNAIDLGWTDDFIGYKEFEHFIEVNDDGTHFKWIQRDFSSAMILFFENVRTRRISHLRSMGIMSPANKTLKPDEMQLEEKRVVALLDRWKKIYYETGFPILFRWMFH